MRRSTSVFVLLLSFALASPAVAAPVARVAEDLDRFEATSQYPDFDVRISASQRVKPSAVQAAAARATGFVIRFDPTTAAVRSIFPTDGALTAPSKQPLDRAALSFLRTHAPVFALSDRDLGSFAVRRTIVEPAGNAYVFLEQRDFGRRVYGSTLTFGFDKRRRLTFITSQYRPGLGAVALRTIDARDAFDAAAASVGATRTGSARYLGERDGVRRYSNPFARGLRNPSDLRAELVTFAGRGAQLDRVAWEVEIEIDDDRWFKFVVDAQTSQVLLRRSNYFAAGPQGTVFTGEHPAESGPRSTVAFSGIDGSWVSGTETTGNNVDAYEDRDADDAADAGSRPSNADAHFDYSWTDAYTSSLGTDLETDRLAAVTQLFYYTNRVHDFLYPLGFTEEWRNFQTDNFGRGGSGGDPVLAEARDGYGTGTELLCKDDGVPIPCRNNANFGTSDDGSVARMQMYVWEPDNPYVDGAMDADVIAHEYGHGLAVRLVGDGNYGSGHQVGSLGEGWSDVVSMMMWDDPVIGEYVTGNTETGIRGVRYDDSPLTLADYDNARGVHRNGRIWATVMWDVLELFRAKYGTDAGMQRFRRLVVDGLKATAEDPTFVDARDGVLGADAAFNFSVDHCLLWAAFAARGFGSNASATQTSASSDDAVPSYCVPTAEISGGTSTPEGTNLVLSGATSSPGLHPSAGVLTYAWDLDGDGEFDDDSGPSATFTDVGDDHTAPIGLKVTNGAGLSDTTSRTIAVTSVAPVPSFSVDPGPEGSEIEITGLVTDPGFSDALTGTVSWGDGTPVQPLFGLLEGERPDATLSFLGSHHYGDNGSYTIVVCGSDEDTTICDDTVVKVDNVTPVVSVATLPPPAPENTAIEVNATFVDPGWLDTYQATIDWGVGDPEPIPAVVTTDGAAGTPDRGTVSGSHVYGDDGVYTVTVSVRDDDGDTGKASFDVVIGNVNPTAVIDKTGLPVFDGVPVKIAHANQVVTFTGDTDDPGSDDETVRWDWDDGAPSPDVSALLLVNAPLSDPLKSPTVQPRDITDVRDHTFAEACVYDVSFSVSDDDAGAAADALRVVITGNEDRTRGAGWWYNEYRRSVQNKNDLATTKLDCYLQIAEAMSSVFDTHRLANTRPQAVDVLNTRQTSAASELLDREILAAWVNFANGSLDLSELVDTNGDGLVDAAFGDVIAAAEAARTNPGALSAELLLHKNRLERVNLRDA